jgi:hypothetical protein
VLVKFFLCAALAAHLCFGHANAGEFAIDPKLVDKVFESAMQDQQQMQAAGVRKSRLEVGYSHMMPREMNLKNKYFEVLYATQSLSLPYGFFRAARPLLSFTGGALNSYFMAGYTNHQGVFAVKGSSGIELKDTLTLQWVPLDVGVSLETRLFSGWLRPALHAGIGADWISQNGSLDGISQNFWLPHFSGGPSVLFFGRDEGQSGFEGVSLAGIYRSSYSNEHRFNGWAVGISGAFGM